MVAGASRTRLRLRMLTPSLNSSCQVSSVHHVPRAEIELIELGESNPERQAELNKTVEEWKENFPAFKKRYQDVRDWLIKWDAQRLAKKTAQIVLPQPARSKRAQQRAQRDEQIWEIIQTGKEGIEYTGSDPCTSASLRKIVTASLSSQRIATMFLMKKS
jgi:hypothetical protein